MRKICKYCSKRKNIKSFDKHTHYKDNLDARCKKCKNKQVKIRKKLVKKSPKKTSFCYCCGVKSKKICLDHDHTTNFFRGWVCEPCNIGLGKLGDDLIGIANAMYYLLSTKKRFSPQEIEMMKQIRKAIDEKIKLNIINKCNV